MPQNINEAVTTVTAVVKIKSVRVRLKFVQINKAATGINGINVHATIQLTEKFDALISAS